MLAEDICGCAAEDPEVTCLMGEGNGLRIGGEGNGLWIGGEGLGKAFSAWVEVTGG